MRLDIALALVLDRSGERILLAKRRKGQHLAGLWEFPGGKIEDNESPEAAVQRECLEEVGVQLSDIELLCEIDHQYDDRHVCLHCFIARADIDSAVGAEKQEVAVFPVIRLPELDMPAANLTVINKFRQKHYF